MLTRRKLDCLGAALAVAAWVSVWFSLIVFVVLIIAAALAFTVAGFLARQEAECGYAETPYGHGPHPAAAPVVDLNSRRPVWPNSAGAPE